MVVTALIDFGRKAVSRTDAELLFDLLVFGIEKLVRFGGARRNKECLSKCAQRTRAKVVVARMAMMGRCEELGIGGR